MRLIETTKTFKKEEKGTIAILWAMALVVFIGFVSIVFDIGRVAITQGELQTFVDHVALASATELNGEDGARANATLAASNLITDSHSFGTNSGLNNGNGTTLAGANVDFTLRFLSDLPADDESPITVSFVASNDAEAAFVEVTAIPHSVELPFFTALRGLLSGTTTQEAALVSASAVAGAGTEICDVPPVFFCKPTTFAADGSVSSTSSLTDPEAFGTMVRLRTGGSNGGWGPGNFGFLDPTRYVDPSGPCGGVTGLSGIIGCMVGAERTISTCVSTRGVDLDPGQSVGINDASWNVRFDMFEATQNNSSGPAFNDYTASPNLNPGLAPPLDGCHANNPIASDHLVPLPRDAIFASNSAVSFSSEAAGLGTNVTSDFNSGDTLATAEFFDTVDYDSNGVLESYSHLDGTDVTLSVTPMEEYILRNHNLVTYEDVSGTDVMHPVAGTAAGADQGEIDVADASVWEALTDNRLGYEFDIDASGANNPGGGDFKVSLADLPQSEPVDFLQAAKRQVVSETSLTEAPITRFEIYLREIYMLNNPWTPPSDPTASGLDTVTNFRDRDDFGNDADGLDPIFFGENYDHTTGAINDIAALESGTRTCSVNPSSGDPFRRVILAAEIDCNTTPLNGRQRGIEPDGFALIFLTEPVGNDGSTSGGGGKGKGGGGGSGTNFDIWGEVLGDATVGLGGVADSGGRIREVVRLLR